MATGEPSKPKQRPARAGKAPVPPLTRGGGSRHSAQRSTDVHKDGWGGVYQDPSTYLTTQQLAMDLEKWIASRDDGRQLIYPESVYRWCREWFGDLPPGRSGPKMGYRIPPVYRYVARVWHLTKDPDLRKVALDALLSDDKDGISPKPWVVVVANLGSTHYAVSEVAGRVHNLLTLARQRNRMVHALFVGDERNPENG